MDSKKISGIRNIRHIFVILFLLLVLLFSFNFTACEPKERIIKIGNQAVLSGDYKFYGEDQFISIKLAAYELSPVRIGGFEYSIDVITKDDEGNVEKAYLVSKELIDEGALAVVGSTFNGTTKVSIPVYMEYNIPVISPSAQETELSRVGENFFRPIINNKQKIENIAFFIKDQVTPQKLVMLDNRSEYSSKLVDFLGEMLEDIEVVVLKRYSFDFISEDIDLLAENLLLDEPDAIFLCADYDEVSSFLSKIREIGITSTVITEELAMDERISLLTAKEDLEGLVAIVPEPPSLAKYSEDAKAVDFWRKYNDFVKKVESIDIEQPGPYASYSYDSVYILVDAMKKANSIIPDDFIKELRNISYDGVTGHIEFDSNGDRVNPPSTVFIVRDGSWVRY